MPTSCDCGEIEVENCPPYLSVETFNDYTSRLCSNCSAIDETAINADVDSSTYLQDYALDDCCPILTVYRGNQIIYSFDGGNTWVETGVAMSRVIVSYGALTFTAGSSQTPAINNVNSTFERNDRSMMELTAGALVFRETGNYYVTVDYIFAYTTTSNMVMHIELMVGGLAATPYRQAHTMAFNNTSSPTELGNSDFMRFSFLRRFTADKSISFLLNSQTTTFGSSAAAYINIVKLSN